MPGCLRTRCPRCVLDERGGRHARSVPRDMRRHTRPSQILGGRRGPPGTPQHTQHWRRPPRRPSAQRRTRHRTKHCASHLRQSGRRGTARTTRRPLVQSDRVGRAYNGWRSATACSSSRCHLGSSGMHHRGTRCQACNDAPKASCQSEPRREREHVARVLADGSCYRCTLRRPAAARTPALLL